VFDELRGERQALGTTAQSAHKRFSRKVVEA
jgi:hypothetical protein